MYILSTGTLLCTNYVRRRLLTEGVSDPEDDDDLCDADDQAANDQVDNEHDSADNESDTVIGDVNSASDKEDGGVPTKCKVWPNLGTLGLRLTDLRALLNWINNFYMP